MSFNAYITNFYLGDSYFKEDGSQHYNYSVETDELRFTGEMYCEGDVWFTKPTLFSYFVYPTEKLVITVDIYKSLGKNDIWMHLKDDSYDKFKNKVSNFIKEQLGNIDKFVKPYQESREKYTKERQKYIFENPRNNLKPYVYYRKMQKEIGSKNIDTTHLNFDNIINKPIVIG